MLVLSLIQLSGSLDEINEAPLWRDNSRDAAGKIKDVTTMVSDEIMLSLKTQQAFKIRRAEGDRICTAKSPVRFERSLQIDIKRIRSTINI